MPIVLILLQLNNCSQFGEPRQKPRFHQVFAGAWVRKNSRLLGPRSVYNGTPNS